MLDVLAWIWDTITEPVLEFVSMNPVTAPAESPMICWLPTGPLTVLPLHAAGHYGDGREDHSALDRVVSSYTPTIRALQAAQASPWQQAPASPLIVAVPDPSGPRPLAWAVQEAELVMARLPAAAILLADEAATRDAVMAGLRTSDWVHFACHATTDLDYPSENMLLLHAGTLRARDLAALRIPGGRLAFLSACGTALGGSPLPDETIHISSAFQLAGYASVIGTLWSADDSISHEIADITYASLASQTPARAVHHAVSEIRRRYPQSPFLWAAHIYMGQTV
jgi:CHAT domain-containing protein